MRYLVAFDKNWADEFNVYGMAIMNAKGVEGLKLALPYMTYYFGSNEGWEEPGDFDMSDFTITEINDAEVSELLRLVPFRDYCGFPTYGKFPDPLDCMHNIIWAAHDAYDEGGEPEDKDALIGALKVFGIESARGNLETDVRNYIQRSIMG